LCCIWATANQIGQVQHNGRMIMLQLDLKGQNGFLVTQEKESGLKIQNLEEPKSQEQELYDTNIIQQLKNNQFYLKFQKL
jgi:hypothetical protein